MDKLNLFDLFAKITLDTSEYEEGIEDSKKKSSTFFDVLKANLTSQAIVGGFQKISSAVTNFGKAALNGYAEYEQLAGGITTLFEDLSWDIEQYASNAYKSAGLSANEYMSTVMSFAASLNQSLLASEGNISRSADLADQAVTDMADNANKMGTSIEMIQNAYAGFAKGNFTMLDNLKLGYGGTKQEMERLLADAEELSGVEYDISSFASITEAIHVVQEEMGIAGATAAEAATTIEGSVNSMKSAWSNLVVGIGDDNANLELLVGNFIESSITAAGNVIPRIGIILQGIGDAVVAAAPMAIQAGGELIATLTDGAIGGIPDMLARIPEIITKFAQFITANLPAIAGKGGEMINSLIDGFFEALPGVLEQLPEMGFAILGAIAAALSGIFDIGANVVSGLWDGIMSMGGWIKEKVTGFVDGIVDGVKETLGIHSPSRVFASIGGYMAEGLGDGWDDEYSTIKKHIEGGLNFGTGTVDFSASGIGTASSGIMNGFASSLGNANIMITVSNEFDGATMSRKMYRYNLRESELRGGNLVEVN